MNKKQYNFRSLQRACIAIVLLLLVACTGNFEDYNSHPYNPRPKDLTPSATVGGLFEKMMYQMHHHQENDSQMIDQMVGDQYGGYLVTPTMWHGTNFSTYNQADNWNEIPFTTPFPNLYSNWLTIAEISEGRGYIYAWANIIRVAAMLRVTDTYGPMPYSKVGGGKLSVAYDSEEEVYKNMIADLTNSTNVLETFWASNSGAALPIAQYDIVYHGNFGQWVKFANSLKLRLAMRISNVAADYAKTVAEEAVASGVFTSNSDNATLPSTDNPYRKAAADWNDLRFGADIASYMTGYSDPRLTYYATPASGGGYRGVRMGVNTTDNSKADYDGFSRPNFTHTSPMLVMNAAEVAFLKAEGALKGWNMGGTAQALYEQGVTLSMTQYGIPAASITAYLNGSTPPAAYTGLTAETNHAAMSTITVKWDDAASTEQKLERIITQKWLANYTLGFEAWSEYRRTGYPKLFPTVTDLSGGAVNIDRGARRLRFPISEYTRNSTNVQAAVQMIGGQDLPSVDLWWAKKN
ncbi:MAG: SusD/RagB family nutrient-binding outer membrane lipoprotein [Prevotellaceae bacterium]|jgi:hypothetical protein|nr:SusD/RagB family nutrient-binding outer membrane lipoprotein [Prevotellaceae bacterium]